MLNVYVCMLFCVSFTYCVHAVHCVRTYMHTVTCTCYCVHVRTYIYMHDHSDSYLGHVVQCGYIWSVDSVSSFRSAFPPGARCLPVCIHDSVSLLPAPLHPQHHFTASTVSLLAPLHPQHPSPLAPLHPQHHFTLGTTSL